MAKQQIELGINTTYSGEGFKKLDAALKSSAGSVRTVTGQVGHVIDAVGDLGGSVSKVTGPVGKLVSSFLAGGVWGVAIAGAASLVGWFVKLVNPVDEVTEAFRRQQKELKSLDAMARGYQKRVESWKQAARDREAAEKDAAKAAEEAAKKAQAEDVEGWRTAREWLNLQSQLVQEQMKSGLYSKDENVRLQTRVALLKEAAAAEVKAAEIKTKEAKADGGGFASDIAAKNLEIALAKQKTVEAEAQKMLDDYKQAKEEAEKKAKAEEEARARELKHKRAVEDAEKKIASIREDSAKKVAEIDAQIAAAKKEAARLEENAQRARGVGFGDWQRGERDRAREQRTNDRRQKNREKSVDQELERLMKKNPKALTDWEKDRIKKLRTWKLDQDPNNNPALKAQRDLEKKREELVKQQAKDISDIRKALAAGGLNI